VILGALLLATAPVTAVDAERAFAADAQTLGQWTAFRKWAAPDAILFVPKPVKVQEFLKDAKNPPLTYQWWPAQAFVSCNGRMAVTTGPSVRGSYRGYFTTVWQRQPDGAWRWVLDHGDALAQPRPAGEKPKVVTAPCPTEPHALGIQFGSGANFKMSEDGSLYYLWRVDEETGARVLYVHLWDGHDHKRVLEDRVGPTE
jgi:hypothetical protein